MEKFPQNISRVTREEVYQAAQKYLFPEKAIWMVVGDKNKYQVSLAGLGALQEIKIEKTQRTQK